MAAILHDVRHRIAVSAQHTREDVFGKKIRFFSPNHQDGNVDSIPIFPEVHAIVPRISERVRDIGIAQGLVALPLRLPFHAVNRQMTPVLVFQFSERSQNAPRYNSAALMVSKSFGASLRLAPRRSNPAHGRYGPMSLITMRRMGLPGSAARTMPIRPPNDVPSQSISTHLSAAIKAVMSLQYWGNT